MNFKVYYLEGCVKFQSTHELEIMWKNDNILTSKVLTSPRFLLANRQSSAYLNVDGARDYCITR